MMINMRRQQLSNLTIESCDHAGLLIDRGFKTDRGDKLHNDDKMELFAKAATVAEKASPFYKKFYTNWQQQLFSSSDNTKVWHGKLINRMYLGMGEASPLEAGITLHHTYGVPYIPGSAIKGVLHHYADDIGLSNEINAVLFGEEARADDKQDSGASGYIIFNDAWWIPEGKALAPEMITVHAPKYYTSMGTDAPHPDFESPNPNPQIAIRGSFLFSVEGEPKWAEYAINLLEKALNNMGIGGKPASGYGYFVEDKKETKSYDYDVQEYAEKIEKLNKDLERAKMNPVERDIEDILLSSKNNSAVTLLQAIESGKWNSEDEKREVSRKIKEIMQENKEWIPDFSGTNKKRLKLKARAIKVLQYLGPDIDD